MEGSSRGREIETRERKTNQRRVWKRRRRLEEDFFAEAWKGSIREGRSRTRMLDKNSWKTSNSRGRMLEKDGCNCNGVVL